MRLMNRLIGRERELASLTKRYTARAGQLVIVWGRRRIGKSYLLQQFTAERRTVFHTATQQAEKLELLAFTENVRGKFADDALPPGYVFPTWDDALTFVATRGTADRTIVVLDEFPYLVDSSPGLESVVQRWWDRVGRTSNVMLVLCGSAQAFMQSLDRGTAPLHQRATAKLEIGPLDYRAAAAFMPAASPTDKAIAYGALGGTPLYLEQWEADKSVRDNLLELFADPGSMLVDAAETALSEELAETEGSLRIMQAIAAGNTRPSAIKDYAKVTPERPLKRLTAIKLVERRVPILEDPLKTRRSYYRIADPYFRFYFRFIARRRGDIGRGLGERLVSSAILPMLDDYMGSIFEDMAREHARHLAIAGALEADRVDSWWSSDGSTEVDVVGLAGGRITFVGTAKWNQHPAQMRVLAELEKHVANLPGDATQALRLVYVRGGSDERVAALQSVRSFSLAEMYA